MNINEELTAHFTKKPESNVDVETSVFDLEKAQIKELKSKMINVLNEQDRLWGKKFELNEAYLSARKAGDLEMIRQLRTEIAQLNTEISRNKLEIGEVTDLVENYESPLMEAVEEVEIQNIEEALIEEEELAEELAEETV